MKLNKVRPRFWDVSPLPAAIVLIYGIVNVLMGLAMMPLDSKNLVVTSVTPWEMWGAFYLGLGLVMLWGLIYNHWKLMRLSMAVGVFAKAIFWISIIVTIPSEPRGIFILLLWSCFVCIQIATYVHFLPAHFRRANNE